MSTTEPPRPAPSTDIEHGTHSSYTNHGCHCEACTEAHRQTMAAYRTAQRERGGLPEGDHRHGSTNGYRNHGCRCPACKAAQAAAAREARTIRNAAGR